MSEATKVDTLIDSSLFDKLHTVIVEHQKDYIDKTVESGDSMEHPNVSFARISRTMCNLQISILQQIKEPTLKIATVNLLNKSCG